ncbi:MAG TPA: endolytic transglycosylase MltG [Candidatus Paceibacterota bacterium]
MKLRYTILFFLLSTGTLFGLVKYYNFDSSVLTSLSFYESLANPSVRIVRIPEGLRKEQIAYIMATKLDWNEGQKDDFVNIHLALNTTNLEGRYFPKTYMIDKDENPSGVSASMFHEFATQTGKIKKPKATKVINDETVLKVASIIQREAGGKSDMKLISGIIWNRIFSGMKLQMDATLQYAKGSEEDGWWRAVTPADKKIDSTYNTYLHAGLPPSAISNPGLAAIEAAYNPQKTSCLFYLHDKKGNIHCSVTYSQHKANIKKYY